MSHRIKRFAAFAIFALFYHFAAVDSILGLGGHHVDTKVDTKNHHRNDKIKSTRRDRVLVSTFPGQEAKRFAAIRSPNAAGRWCWCNLGPAPTSRDLMGLGMGVACG